MAVAKKKKHKIVGSRTFTINSLRDALVFSQALKKYIIEEAGFPEAGMNSGDYIRIEYDVKSETYGEPYCNGIIVEFSRTETEAETTEREAREEAEREDVAFNMVMDHIKNANKNIQKRASEALTKLINDPS